MIRNTQISIPTLVRIKPDSIDNIGIYARRNQFFKLMLLTSEGLDPSLIERVKQSFAREPITLLNEVRVSSSDLETAQAIFQSMPQSTNAIIGLGGGKALDVAKYVSFLSRIPYISMPTSLSNDGFCSPQSSLEYKKKRRSYSSVMPYGVVIDTRVCMEAPEILWHSGVGDLVAKITAAYDWKLAHKIKGIQLDDFSELLSDATVFQFMARPKRDLEGIRLLGTALLLNGIAMEICGSSRPASGSEHLISHALDSISKKPRLHGLQVGIASYVISRLQGHGTERISELFDATGFWDAVRKDPFIKSEWLEAFRLAPNIKSDFYTVLSERDCFKEFKEILDHDTNLLGIFV